MEEKSEANYHSSSSSSSSNSSANSKKNNIKILNNRLQVLEQESEKMRQVLVVCMDERRELISEILQLFQTLCTNCKGAITRPHLSFCQVIKHNFFCSSFSSNLNASRSIYRWLVKPGSLILLAVA